MVIADTDLWVWFARCREAIVCWVAKVQPELLRTTAVHAHYVR